MNDLDTWTAFFGWLTIVNLGIYLITVLAIFAMREFVYNMNAKMFGISKEDVAIPVREGGNEDGSQV